MVMKRAVKKEKKQSALANTGAEAKTPIRDGTVSIVEYTKGTWKGLPHFQCNKCPYSTLDEKSMQAHADDHKKREKRAKK